MNTHPIRTKLTASAAFKKATIIVTTAAILGAGLSGCVIERVETDTVYTSPRATVSSYPTTAYTYYTVDQFHDDYAIDVELRRLKKDSQRRRNEAARAHLDRMDRINRQQDELRRLQKERIRNNDRRLQNQRDDLRREEDRRRQRENDARSSNSRQRDRDAKKQQERRDYELATKLQIEEIEKERKLREREQRQSRDSSRKSERVKREADAAERRHVDEVYRKQQKERDRQQSQSSSSSQKSSVQEQIDNDYELAKKLQEEEFAKAGVR